MKKKEESIKIPLFMISTSGLENMNNQINSEATNEIFEVMSYNGTENTNEKMWDSIFSIIAEARQNELEVIAILNGEHNSFNAYCENYLLENIVEANAQHADILLGHVCDFTYAVPIAKNRFWIDRFTSSDFFIIYRKLYDRILSISDGGDESAFDILSRLTANKMTLFPFVLEDIATQKNQNKFGANKGRGKIKLAIYDKMINKYLV